ncbi:MAG: tetratricopeptide repeat protein [Planctomycetes bacterium]|nr:tetratricopeptide repeat protein [Planctomycetota bacterium]
MHAENAYLFRHALLRDAAYQLQMPGDRARLHGIAFDLIEQLCGGRPTAAALDVLSDDPAPRHACDPFARELAEHAAAAGMKSGVRAEYLRRAAEFAQRLFATADAERLWTDMAGLLQGLERAAALRFAGVEAWHGGRPRRAWELLSEAREICRGAGDEGREAVIMGNLGTVLRTSGRMEEAEKLLEPAIERSRTAGNRRAEARDILNLGNIYHATGRTEAARRVFVETLTLCESLGGGRVAAMAISDLATLETATGHMDEAERLLDHAIEIQRELHDTRGEALGLENLAIVHRATGRTESAERLYGLAMDIHRRTGGRFDEASVRAIG